MSNIYIQEPPTTGKVSVNYFINKKYGKIR